MRISPLCYAVTGLGYVPPWSVNAGFVVGGHTTLVIDTGANALAAATIHGYATAARPANRLLVVNTEKHFDHIGGNGFFRNLAVDVTGHAGIARTQEEFLREQAEFNAAIPDPPRRARGEAAAFYAGTTLANPNHPVSADTNLDLGECTVRLVLTPGHTPTNLSVYVPGDEVLYCGDCLANLYHPNLDAGTLPDWREWLHSLDRIEELAPRAIVPGHGPVATGGDVPRLIESVRKVVESAIATAERQACSPPSRPAAG
jgi:glyoxylase-like metal-dependent hydrolase (beta-lactamase superfamily II)